MLVQIQMTLVDEAFVASATRVTLYPMKVCVIFLAHRGVTDFATCIIHIRLAGMSQSMMGIPLLYTLKGEITFFDYACKMVLMSIFPFYTMLGQFKLVSLCCLYTQENVNLLALFGWFSFFKC